MGPNRRNTGVTFAYANMLREFRENPEITHLLMVFDHKDPTFRHIMFPEYKAHRDPMPDDLREQMPDIKELADVSGVPVVSMSGYEADDVIATLAKEAGKDGLDVRICSNDKDLDQIINERIALWDPAKKIIRGPDEMVDKKGIHPHQVIDYLSMIGDSADNVPGIKGVGPKTAIKLLTKYDTLDNVLAHTDELKGKQKENIEAFKDVAKLTKDLITIVDVPDAPSYKEFPKLDTIPDSAKDFYEKLGFSVNKFFPTKTCAASDNSQYELLTSKTLKPYLDRIRKHGRCAFDTETTGLEIHSAQLVGISLAYGEHDERGAAYLPILGPDQDSKKLVAWDDVKDELKEFFEDESIKKIAQNAKYDIRIFGELGIQVKGLDGDPMIASWLLDPARPGHGLDYLTKSFLQEDKIPTSDVIDLKGGQTMAEVSVDTVMTYACEDAQCTWRLAQLLEADLKKEQLLSVYREQEIPLVSCLAKMESKGFHVDAQVFKDKQQHLEAYLDQVLTEIRKLAGDKFNPASPKQVATLLFEELKLPVIRKTKRGPSTDAQVLEALRHHHELPDLILQFRVLSKLIGTYLRTLPDFINPASNSIHSNFHQIGTETGRLSSDHPNLQNIPKKTDRGREIRAAFTAREGHQLLAADYSQIELRVLAHFSGDSTLQAAFQDDVDIHRFVAAQVNDVSEEEVTPQMRQAAKAINFGIIYGQSAFGLAGQLGINRNEAQRFIDDYFARFADVRDYIDGVVAKAEEIGYVETIAGRRRYIPLLKSSNHNERLSGRRTALNSTIQGSAADLIKRAMLRCDDMLPKEAHLLIQIHDELIVETPDSCAQDASQALEKAMLGAWQLNVPLRADVRTGADWLAVS